MLPKWHLARTLPSIFYQRLLFTGVPNTLSHAVTSAAVSHHLKTNKTPQILVRSSLPSKGQQVSISQTTYRSLSSVKLRNFSMSSSATQTEQLEIDFPAAEKDFPVSVPKASLKLLFEDEFNADLEAQSECTTAAESEETALLMSTIANSNNGTQRRSYTSSPQSPKRKSHQYALLAKAKLKVWSDKGISIAKNKADTFNSRRYANLQRAIDKSKKIFQLRNSIVNRREQLARVRQSVMENTTRASKGFVALWKKYGWIGLMVYFGVYFTCVGIFFFAANCGLLTGDQVRSWAEYFHLENHIDLTKLDKVDSSWGRLIIAWLATKLVEPLRLCFTITITPSIARLIRGRRPRR